jgi:hypothetical protein
MSFYESLQESFTEVTADQLVLRSFFALGVIIVGIFIGKIIDWLLRKLFNKLDIVKHIRGTFVDIFLLVIRWTIYIFFINLGLNQLGLPVVSDFFSSILITIPAFTGALLLLVIGIGLAFYLRRIIKNSETKGGDFIAEIIFYFVIFVFGIYAVWIALIPMDPATRNTIIIVLVAVASAGVIYNHAKK